MTSSEHFAAAATRARVRPDGRWAGAITRRPLPDSTEELDALPRPLRLQLSAIWHSQAATEARVAHSFALIHESLSALEADAALIALAERAIDDEHRHAALCEDVAGRYLGETIPPHAALPFVHPAHPDADPALRRVLFVIGQCALNETFANAYLSAARERVESPLVRAAITELMQDEIDHARIGWAFVSTLDTRARLALEQWLVPLAACNLREWTRIELPPDEHLSTFGIPSRPRALDAIHAALSGVVVAGFDHLGLDTRALRRWISTGAET